MTKHDPWRFQRWAFDTVTGSSTRKATLSMLAMMADAQTGRCEAKQETLAKGVEASERSVRDHLKALEDAELIARRSQFRKDGSRRGDEYLLRAPWVTEWPDGDPLDHRQISPEADPAGGEIRYPPRGIDPAGQELPLEEQPLKEPTPTPPASGQGRRANGTSLRQQGLSPRQLGTSPRQQGTSPRQTRAASLAPAVLDERWPAFVEALRGRVAPELHDVWFHDLYVLGEEEGGTLVLAGACCRDPARVLPVLAFAAADAGLRWRLATLDEAESVSGQPS